MNILKSARIKGLWGEQGNDISFDFDKQFNFIIGKNGTGKTTVINLIAAALVADFGRLDRINFSQIDIVLKEVKGRRNPSITIKKIPKQDVPYFDITYQIKETATSQPKNFDLDALAEERFYRGLPQKMLRERFFREKFVDVQRELESYIKVCWLSVNRHADVSVASDDNRRLSSVDQKLVTLNNDLVRYFSQLARRYADHTLLFQQNSFLSLLTSEKEAQLIGFSKSIDVDSERKSLSKVFELLGVDSKVYSNKLKTHLDKFSDAVKSFEQKNKSNLTTNEFAAMYNAWKTHSLVQHYQALQQKRSEIFQPKDNFIDVVNGLLGGRKTISISERNEVVATTKAGVRIPIEELSSGEKQLLIILGEALLQENSSVIYIADEPELSLHVAWQEQLTDAINKLNPNAQIVFATHSPDIVGGHSDKVIDMEVVLN